MSGLLDWWYRIRSVVRPPGASATRAAVPADVGAATAAELVSVFAHVDRLEPELAERETAGRHESEAILATADEQVDRVAGDARERIAATRADAAAARQAEFRSHARELERRAEDEAAAVRVRAEALMPALVADVLTRVRAFAVGPDRPERSTEA